MSIKLFERGTGRVLQISVDEIKPAKEQPRRTFDEEELRSLARSVAQDGIIQPLTVRKSGTEFELIAGERRLRAAILAGLSTVPCIVIEADDNQSAVLSLIENLQREDLGFYDESMGIDRLIKMHGLTQEKAAERLGLSQSAVANKLRLLRLPPEQLQLLSQKGFTERHARALVCVEDDALRGKLIDKMIRSQLTVAATEELVTQAVKPLKHKPMKYGAIKDVRIFINTVAKALTAMRSSGIQATTRETETENTFEYTIVISKKEESRKLTVGIGSN